MPTNATSIGLLAEPRARLLRHTCRGVPLPVEQVVRRDARPGRSGVRAGISGSSRDGRSGSPMYSSRWNISTLPQSMPGWRTRRRGTRSATRRSRRRCAPGRVRDDRFANPCSPHPAPPRPRAPPVIQRSHARLAIKFRTMTGSFRGHAFTSLRSRLTRRSARQRRDSYLRHAVLTGLHDRRCRTGSCRSSQLRAALTAHYRHRCRQRIRRRPFAATTVRCSGRSAPARCGDRRCANGGRRPTTMNCSASPDVETAASRSVR